jgi:hypothetical protein
MWFILATNAYMNAQLFGTKQAKAYQSENAAERMAARLRKRHPTLDFLVLPVSEVPETL